MKGAGSKGETSGFVGSQGELMTSILSYLKRIFSPFDTGSLLANYTQRVHVLYNNMFMVLCFCSASGIFTKSHGFVAIVRKRVASLMRRIRGSDKSFLSVIAFTVHKAYRVVFTSTGPECMLTNIRNAIFTCNTHPNFKYFCTNPYERMSEISF